MCYGICSFESYPDGECSSMLLSCSKQIKETIGYSPCFIGGGDRTCPEDWEYWEELNKQGKIKEYKDIVNNVVRKEYENIEKIRKGKIALRG